MATRLNVKKGYSVNPDVQQAVAELAQSIAQPDANIAVIFCSSFYDRVALGHALKMYFDCPVVACTTAGEIIEDAGYITHSLTGVSLSSSELFVQTKLIYPLEQFDISKAQQLAGELQSNLKLSSTLDAQVSFGMLFVDGMSMLEEQVIACLYDQMGGVPIIGGSAGDDLAFKETFVYWDGEFIGNAALFTLFETTLNFQVFQTQHFEATDNRLVITDSHSETRTVTEINGAPAAEEYARAVGVDIQHLEPQIFAAYPMLLKIGDKYHVRSIQKTNPDGSLTFYCAIDTGLVLRVGKGMGLLQKLRQHIDEIHQSLPNTQLVLGCDCILRRLELQQKGLIAEAKETLHGSHFVGFSTYGEQINSVHVNQTLTGVALAG